MIMIETSDCIYNLLLLVVFDSDMSGVCILQH